MTSRILVPSLFVFALSALPVAAADAPTAGVVVGANFASAGLSGTDAFNVSTGYKTGLYVGGFMTWPLNGHIAIQPEVAYSQKHFTATDAISGHTATEDWDWIEVPILARISFSHEPSHGLYVVGGPGFGFLARAKEEALGQTVDVKADVQSVDVSLIGGAGLSMGKAAVEVRYDGGLRDLNKDSGLGPFLTAKSRAITVDLRWTFR